MTGEGLEPSTNGLTYLIGFHRPPRSIVLGPLGVECLDYPTAIAGVPRLVSEAAPGAPPRACLLIAQSPPFSNRHDGRCRLPLWCAELSGGSSILRHSLIAVRFLPARGSRLVYPFRAESPLLYRLSYPVNHPRGKTHLSFESARHALTSMVRLVYERNGCTSRCRGGLHRGSVTSLPPRTASESSIVDL
jgi:hypothetical protein